VVELGPAGEVVDADRLAGFERFLLGDLRLEHGLSAAGLTNTHLLGKHVDLG
jgi:hypothetical protein